MLVQGQKVILNLCQKKILDYYRSKGYNCEAHKDFYISVDDLKPSSHIKIEVLCDYCGANYQMEYRHYVEDVINGFINKCACKKCGRFKLLESIVKKYGVRSTSCLKDVKEKQKLTCLKKYGALYPMQSDIVKETLKLNNLKKYGVSSVAKLQGVRDKIKNTSIEKYGVDCWLTLPKAQKNRELICLKKYGVSNPFLSPDTKLHIRETNIKKYGVPNPMQNSSIAEKARNTMFANGSVPTSYQQKHLAELFNGVLNYPVEKYSVDILIEQNIAIEYNGGGHDLQVKFGTLKLDEFIRKENARYYCLKRNGYRCITFVNTLDKKYSDSLYLELLDSALHILKDDDINWVEVNLDKKFIKTKKEQLGLKESSELFK